MVRRNQFVFVIARGVELFFLFLIIFVFFLVFIETSVVFRIFAVEVIFGGCVQFDEFILKHHDHLSVRLSSCAFVAIDSTCVCKTREPENFLVADSINRITRAAHK
jgi:hypothetical protein